MYFKNPHFIQWERLPAAIITAVPLASLIAAGRLQTFQFEQKVVLVSTNKPLNHINQNKSHE